MITKFGSLFAGHVDLDDEGLDGIAANDRWLSDECRARVPHARGRDLRRAAPGPGREPRAVRGAGRHHLQVVQRAGLLAPGQVLHTPAPGALPRLRAPGAHAGAAPEDVARRVLAAG